MLKYIRIYPKATDLSIEWLSPLVVAMLVSMVVSVMLCCAGVVDHNDPVSNCLPFVDRKQQKLFFTSNKKWFKSNFSYFAFKRENIFTLNKSNYCFVCILKVIVLSIEYLDPKFSEFFDKNKSTNWTFAWCAPLSMLPLTTI